MSTREAARAGGAGEDRGRPYGSAAGTDGGGAVRSSTGDGPAEPAPGGRKNGPGRPGSGRRERARRTRRTPLRARLRRDWPLLVMVAPAALLLLVFHYLPTLGNVVAFQDYNPYAGDTPLAAFTSSPWIGFGQFEALFGDPAFWDALRNTLAITAFQLVFFFPLPVVLAIMLHNILSRDCVASCRPWSICRTSSVGCWW